MIQYFVYRPTTGPEGPEEWYMYSFTLSLVSALDGGWMVNSMPHRLFL